MTEKLLNKVAEVKHIESADTLEKFSKVTGLIYATEEMMNDENADWYIPAGAFIPSDAEIVEAHVGEEVVEGVNDQYDVDNDGDIDADDVVAAKEAEANSEITVTETYTAAEAIAYNATLPGAVKAGDVQTPGTEAVEGVHYTAEDEEVIAGTKTTDDWKVEPVNAVDPVLYTEETAAAYNATLDGAIKEGDPK